MSLLRITGQRPESGAAPSTAAASSLASSIVSEKRSTSWRRKLPVPCEQRLFSRKTSRPLARSSSTEKPWLPMETTVAGSGPARKRQARAWACWTGTRGRRICRLRRPHTAAAASVSQSHVAQQPEQRRPGFLVVLDDLAPAPLAAGAVLDELGELDGLGADIDAEVALRAGARARPGRRGIDEEAAGHGGVLNSVSLWRVECIRLQRPGGRTWADARIAKDVRRRR